MRLKTWAASALAVWALAAPAKADEYPCGNRVTMWDEPYRVCSYRRVGEIYDSQRVARGTVVTPLPYGEQLDGITYTYQGKQRQLAHYFAKARTTGLIVLKNGRVVYEHYGYGANERSALTSQSMAKSMTSALVGFAIADGTIKSVDDPITDYVPELKTTGYNKVPIKAILQMSSGVLWREDYSASHSDSTEFFDRVMVHNSASIPEFLQTVQRGPIPPFGKFQYASIETNAIGELVRKATGKSLAAYLSEKIWIPLGMEGDATWSSDGSGNEIASCCLNARLRDFARFGLLMAQKGMWQGKQLLPAKWVDEATRPDRKQVKPGRLYDGYPMGYQYQWWVFPGPDRAFTALGINGQFLYVNPSKNLVIVMTNVWKDWWIDDLESETYAIFDAFAQATDKP
ncbi:MAG: serine hydrolase [Rhizobiales bacterium]|nr:serine hydrolase [Hyphomicrobiales bacterium]